MAWPRSGHPVRARPLPNAGPAGSSFPLPMRVFFALLVALTAAARASAQTPPAAPTPPPPPAAATAAGPAAASDAPLDLPATICGQTVPAAGQAAAGRLAAGRLPADALLREAGRLPGRRGQHLPLLHPDEVAVSLPSTDKWVPYDDAIEQTIVGDFKRLWATNFLDDLAIEVRDVPLRERRHRQGRRLQHGRAAAGQDRRLRRHQEGRPVEDRREAEREAAFTIRLDSFIDPGLHPPRQRRRPRGLRREGLPVRRGQAGDQGGRRRAEARERHLPHHRRAEGQDPRGRLRRQQGDQRRQARAAR